MTQDADTPDDLNDLSNDDGSPDVMDMPADLAEVTPTPCLTPSSDEDQDNDDLRFLGEGVSGSPFIICTGQQLKLIVLEERERMSEAGAHYVLGQDIDLSTGSSWVPIECFRGSLDGAGHSIKGLRYNTSASSGSCDITRSTYVGGFITEVNAGARLTDIRFEDIELGQELSPLPEHYADNSGLSKVGGLFGVVQGARLERLTISGMRIWSNGSIGGVAHTSIDSVWSHIKLCEVYISYVQGQVGGLMRWLKTLNAPASLLEHIDIDVTLTQRTPPTQTNQSTHAYSLLASETQGPFTLKHASITGTIDHVSTPQGTETHIGGVAGRTIDEITSDDLSPRADALRALTSLLSDVKVHDIKMPRCGSHGLCGEVGALCGHMGRDQRLGSITSYSNTPINLEDVEVAGNELSGQRAATLVGNRLNAPLMMARVSIHGNVISSTDSSSDELACLVHSTKEGISAVSVGEMCVVETTCNPGLIMNQCDKPGFRVEPWTVGTNPPELLR